MNSTGILWHAVNMEIAIVLSVTVAALAAFVFVCVWLCPRVVRWFPEPWGFRLAWGLIGTFLIAFPLFFVLLAGVLVAKRRFK